MYLLSQLNGSLSSFILSTGFGFPSCYLIDSEMKRYSAIVLITLLGLGLSGGYLALRYQRKADQAHLENLKSGQIPFRGTTFDIIHVQPMDGDLRLYWKDHSGDRLGSFGNLKKEVESQGESLLFATNAGIFSKNFTPGGLHIENGVTLKALNTKEGEGNFHLMPNGVFLIGNKGPKVVETHKFAGVKDSIYYATQSGPLLVIEGELHPAFNKGSSNKYIRNGVGVTANGNMYFAISREPVNFYDFAVFFRDKLNCPNALYLDGSISDFYLPELGRTYEGGNFTGMIALVKSLPHGNSTEPASAEGMH